MRHLVVGDEVDDAVAVEPKPASHGIVDCHGDDLVPYGTLARLLVQRWCGGGVNAM